MGGYPRAAEAEPEEYINNEGNSELPEISVEEKGHTGAVTVIAIAGVVLAAVGVGIGFILQKKRRG